MDHDEVLKMRDLLIGIGIEKIQNFQKIRAHEVFGTNYNENRFISFFNFSFTFSYLPVVLVKTLFLNYLLLILEPLYEIHF